MLVMLLTVLADYAVILFTVRAITSTANNSIAIRNSSVSKQIHHHILRVLVIQVGFFERGVLVFRWVF